MRERNANKLSTIRTKTSRAAFGEANAFDVRKTCRALLACIERLGLGASKAQHLDARQHSAQAVLIGDMSDQLACLLVPVGQDDGQAPAALRTVRFGGELVGIIDDLELARVDRHCGADE